MECDTAHTDFTFSLITGLFSHTVIHTPNTLNSTSYKVFGSLSELAQVQKRRQSLHTKAQSGHLLKIDTKVANYAFV